MTAVRGNLAGARVVVLGLGVTGASVARVLASWGAEVFGSDDRADVSVPDGIEAQTGSHDRAMQRMPDADLVVVSPGLAPHTAVVASALASGVEVCSDIELASRVVNAPVVAVTGTNGKTSTCALIAGALRHAGRDVVSCGNEHEPFLSAVDARPDAEVYVVEASSFALEYTTTLRPRVAVFTNIAPDHLDWHQTFDAYRAAKAKITANQSAGDAFVYPCEQPELAAMAPDGVTRLGFSADRTVDADGAWADGGLAKVRIGDQITDVEGLRALRDRGRPFVLDGLAAAAAVVYLGAGSDAVGLAFSGFEPRSHRVELVAEAGGVRFVDDSKATNPHAAVAAIRGMEHVVLIAGGRGKGLDLRPLAAERDRLRAVVALGEAADEVVHALEGSGVTVRVVADMRAAVEVARMLAQPGDVVLLSPACASYDQFRDYAERGREFTRLARSLGAGVQT